MPDFFSKSLATSCAVSCRLGQVWMTVVAIALSAALSAALGSGRVSFGFMHSLSLRKRDVEDGRFFQGKCTT
ncbi:hypothetical protein D9M71_141220 [compost metagenome]